MLFCALSRWFFGGVRRPPGCFPLCPLARRVGPAGRSKYNKYGPIYFTWIGICIDPRPRPPCSGLRPTPHSSRFGFSAPSSGAQYAAPPKPSLPIRQSPDHPPLSCGIRRIRRYAAQMDATAAYYCARRPGVWTTANGCPHPVCVPHIFLFPF